MTVYEFKVRGGQATDGRGKPHWPHQLTLSIDRHDALEIIARLAKAVDKEGEESITCPFVGELTLLTL